VSKRRDLANDIRAALVALGTRVNPMPLIRLYVERSGFVHDKFRAAVKQRETDWESTITNAMRRFERRFPAEKGQPGLAAAVLHSNNTLSDPEHLVQDALDYRAYLKDKNSTTVNLSKRYVTGQIEGS
jgi:hypothetical protein